MHLTDLVKAANVMPQQGLGEVDIAGITADSRRVAPGFLFAALPGTSQDGRSFIADALARGAAAVLAPAGTEAPSLDGQAALLTDPNPRRAYARMAAAFFGVQPGTVAAVTGTNGKTSVAEFTRQIWREMGLSAASLGTLGLRAPQGDRGGALTTPDPAELHRALAELAAADVSHLALEASSHGLSQFRLDGVRVAAGAFTNLSRDHLDYHRSMADYRAAKLRLFEEVVAPAGAAVVPADAPEHEAIAAIAARRGLRLLTYALGDTAADIRCLAARPAGAGASLRLEVAGERYDVDFPLVGDFQISNALAALGLVLACGGAAQKAVPTLARLAPVPGRMQHAASRANGARIFVDYAHTPDALRAALSAARPHAHGRLFVVFGAGGDRDPGKRPEMGRAAAAAADVVIVTDDNPRREDPAVIRRAILAACPGGEEIGDRAQAIARAVARLGPGDVLVIAGKGHEKGQIVGERVLPFDDVAVAGAAATKVDVGTA